MTSTLLSIVVIMLTTFVMATIVNKPVCTIWAMVIYIITKKKNKRLDGYYKLSMQICGDVRWIIAFFLTILLFKLLNVGVSLWRI